MNKYHHLRPPQPPAPRLAGMCAGKRRMRDVAQAFAARDAMERRSGQPFHAYACPLCGWYHVGHARRDANEGGDN